MNFLKLGAISFLFLFVAACSDDESADNQADALLGAWRLTELTYEGSTTVPGPVGVLTTNFSGEGFDMDLIMEFASPDTYTTQGDYGVRLEMETAGVSNTIELTNAGFFDDGTWALENDKLVFTPSGGTEQEATILELNASTLRLTVDVSDLVVSLGTIEELDGTLVLTRQD